MFKHLSNYAKRVNRDEDGQGLVEYALILVLVAVVVVVVLTRVGPSVGNIFSAVVVALDGGSHAGVAGSDDDGSGSGSFSGTITAGDSNDGAGRYFDKCSFTVSETGTYMVATVTTDKSSNFWVTAGPGSAPASGFVMESNKHVQPVSTGTLNAGTTYSAYPHSTTPGDFPISYQFTITGPGNISGSC